MDQLRYTAGAIALHWLSVLAVVSAFGVGWYVAGLGFSPLRIRLLNYHKWLGVTVFLLTLLRLVWRLRHAAPPLAPATPAWQRAAANGMHRLLYALLMLIPLTGWVYSSAKGLPVVYLGVLQFPDLVAPDKALAATMQTVHQVLVYTLAALVGLHVLAALKHQLIDRDGLMRRMLPAALLLAAFGGGLATNDALAQQRLVPEKSEIRFTLRQMGVPVDGRFTRFSADARFDPANLAGSRVVMEIDLASVSLVDAEAQKEVMRPAWFDVPKFPTARFTSTAFRALPGGRYEAVGQLVIKGQTQEVTMPMTVKQDAAGAVVEGQFTVKRLDFKIGEGEWKDVSIVANDVLVRVRLTLTGGPK